MPTSFISVRVHSGLNTALRYKAPKGSMFKITHIQTMTRTSEFSGEWALLLYWAEDDIAIPFEGTLADEQPGLLFGNSTVSINGLDLRTKYFSIIRASAAPSWDLYVNIFYELVGAAIDELILEFVAKKR